MIRSVELKLTESINNTSFNKKDKIGFDSIMKEISSKSKEKSHKNTSNTIKEDTVTDKEINTINTINDQLSKDSKIVSTKEPVQDNNNLKNEEATQNDLDNNKVVENEEVVEKVEAVENLVVVGNVENIQELEVDKDEIKDEVIGDESEECLMELINLLSLLKGEDIQIPTENNLEVGDTSIETMVITESLNTIVELLGNEAINKEDINPEMINKNLEVISKLLDSKGLNSEEVTKLLDKFKNIIIKSDSSNEEVKSIANEIIKEITSTVSNEVKPILVSDNSIISKGNIDGNVMKFQEKSKVVELNSDDDSKSFNDTSEESTEGSNDNTESSFAKEEKILNTILNKNNSDNNLINRFSVFTDNFSKVTTDVAKEGFTVNSSTMTHDITQAIKYMSVKGLEELMVKVNPKGLGELVISVVKEGEFMKAQIKASSKETYNLILQNSDDLKKYLGEQNIKVLNVDISLTKDATDGSQFFGEAYKDNNKQSQSGRGYSNSNDINFEELEDELPQELINNINMLV